MKEIVPKHYSIVSDIVFFIRLFYKEEPLILWGTVAVIFMGTVSPVLGIFLPKFALDLVAKGVTSQRAAVLFGGITVLLIFIYGLHGFAREGMLFGAILVGAPVIGILIGTRNYSCCLLLLVALGAAILAIRADVHFKKKMHYFQFMYNIVPEGGEKERKRKESYYDFTWGFTYGDGFDYRSGKEVRVYDAYAMLERWTRGALRSKEGRAKLKDGALGYAGSGGCTGMVSGIMEGVFYLIVVGAALAGGITVGSLIRFAGCLNKLLRGICELALAVEDFALTCRKHI